MKTMMVMVCLVGMVGCANNNQELQKQLNMSESENARLNEVIKRQETAESFCTQSAAKAEAFKEEVVQKLGEVWADVKAAEPSKKKDAMIELDAIENTIKENANKAYDATKNAASQYLKDHNYTK